MLVGGKVNRLGSSLIWNSVVVEFSSTTFWKLLEGGKVGSSASRPCDFGLSLGSFLSLSPPCLLDVKAFLCGLGFFHRCIAQHELSCLAVSTRNLFVKGAVRGVWIDFWCIVEADCSSQVSLLTRLLGSFRRSLCRCASSASITPMIMPQVSPSSRPMAFN